MVRSSKRREPAPPSQYRVVSRNFPVRSNATDVLPAPCSAAGCCKVCCRALPLSLKSRRFHHRHPKTVQRGGCAAAFFAPSQDGVCGWTVERRSGHTSATGRGGGNLGQPAGNRVDCATML